MLLHSSAKDILKTWTGKPTDHKLTPVILATQEAEIWRIVV
jgi:hypothetical protein